MVATAIVLGVILLTAVCIALHPAFGGLPSGMRLERMRRSPNYDFREGKFRNLEETPVVASDENFFKMMWRNLFPGVEDLKPDGPVKGVKTDLNTLDMDADQMVWFGHSSYLLILGGRKVLVDPVLTSTFPASMMMRPFKGSDLYTPDDLPPIDLLVITHDHFDHLDYATVKALRERVKRVVCPLGVGAHLERWGYEPQKIVELDWNERRTFFGIDVTALPARHFSGRFLWRDNTQWASYMLRSRGKTIYIGGDSGYGRHYRDISRRFPEIDVALLEAGQYDVRWPYIHTMPEYADSVVTALLPYTVIPVHNGKYALARHPWREPVENMKKVVGRHPSVRLSLPVIGEPIPLDTSE